MSAAIVSLDLGWVIPSLWTINPDPTYAAPRDFRPGSVARYLACVGSCRGTMAPSWTCAVQRPSPLGTVSARGCSVSRGMSKSRPPR
jgi:hypothetical protein